MQHASGRQRRRPIRAVGAMLALLLIFATFLIPGRAASEPATTIMVTYRGMTPAPHGNTLFNDDFATQSHRWDESTSPKASVAYRDEALDLRVVSPGVGIWPCPILRSPARIIGLRRVRRSMAAAQIRRLAWWWAMRMTQISTRMWSPLLGHGSCCTAIKAHGLMSRLQGRRSLL